MTKVSSNILNIRIQRVTFIIQAKHVLTLYYIYINYNFRQHYFHFVCCILTGYEILKAAIKLDQFSQKVHRSNLLFQSVSAMLSKRSHTINVLFYVPSLTKHRV